MEHHFRPPGDALLFGHAHLFGSTIRGSLCFLGPNDVKKERSIPLFLCPFFGISDFSGGMHFERFQKNERSQHRTSLLAVLGVQSASYEVCSYLDLCFNSKGVRP